MRRKGRGLKLVKRLKYEDVKKVFDERGCTLLSEVYVKSKDKLSFICTCGRTSEIAFDKFKSGQYCGGCRDERIGKASRHSIEYVRKVFEGNGCKLLSKTYEGNKQKLNYVCNCGNVAYISFAKFQSGQRCKVCKSTKITEKLSGANSPMYNHDKSTEERIRDRKYPEYQKWRRDVFSRDDYTCQCCGEVGRKLNAHHIESYSRNKDLRTDINNGITLCESCHKEYHANFYRNDADKETFMEFMYGAYRDPWYAGEIFD